MDIFVIDIRGIHSLESESRALISSGRRGKYGRMFASGIREHNGIMLSIVSGGGCRGAIWGGLGDTRACVCAHTYSAVCTRAATGRWTGDIASRYVGYARYAGTMFWFWSVRQIRSPFVTEARAFETRERKREKERDSPLHRCAFTYVLPSVLLSTSPFVTRPYPRILLRKNSSTFCVKVRKLVKVITVDYHHFF